MTSHTSINVAFKIVSQSTKSVMINVETLDKFNGILFTKLPHNFFKPGMFFDALGSLIKMYMNDQLVLSDFSFQTEHHQL